MKSRGGHEGRTGDKDVSRPPLLEAQAEIQLHEAHSLVQTQEPFAVVMATEEQRRSAEAWAIRRS